MFNWLKYNISQHKTILENFSYLSILQIITIGTPFIILSYLIKTLGTDKYGAVILSQTIISYLVVFINFGFDLYGTKEIAINKKDKDKMSTIASSILLVKVCLAAFLLIVYFGVIFSIELSHNYRLLYLFSGCITLGEILMPRWYYQGVEKMKYITLFVAVSKIIYLISIFIIVTSESRFYFVPLLNGLSGLLAGLLGLHVMFKVEGILFRRPRKAQVKRIFKEGLPYFMAKSSSQIRDTSNVIIIGLLFSNTYIAFYDLAYKVTTLFTVIFQNVPTVVLPKLSITKSASFARKTFLFSLLFAVSFIAFIQFTAGLIIQTIGGDNFDEAIIYLKTLSVFSIIFAANSLTSYFLIANNMQKFIYKSILLSLMLYLVLVPILLLHRSITLLIIIFLIASFTDFLYKFEKLRKENLTNWIYEPKGKTK